MAKAKAVRVESVLFNGSKHELKALLLKWNRMRGIDIAIVANDYVGGSFDVEFSKSTGVIAQAEADTWVADALRHAAE